MILNCIQRHAVPLLAALTSTYSIQVLAHPGDHGHDWLDAFLHLVTEPDHLAGIVLVALVAGFGVRRLRQGALRRADRATRPTDDQ